MHTVLSQTRIRFGTPTVTRSPSPSPPQRKKWRDACSNQDVTNRVGVSMWMLVARAPMHCVVVTVAMLISAARPSIRLERRAHGQLVFHCELALCASDKPCVVFAFIGSKTRKRIWFVDTRLKMMQDPLAECALRVPWKPTQPQHPFAFYSEYCTIPGNHLPPQRSILAICASVQPPWQMVRAVRCTPAIRQPLSYCVQPRPPRPFRSSVLWT